jgi:DNA repair protein RecN (Recombination protein N)
VRNLAVLSEAALRFGPGLNVLTGETGAGKSLVVDSLALLAGARASGELIRTGADSAQVTGVFEPSGKGWRAPLEGAGVSMDDASVVIRREINREGRNRVFVNDQPITLRLLGDLAPHLLRIHAQNEELRLADPELQRGLLDRCEGEAAEDLLGSVRAAESTYRELAGRLERLQGNERIRFERVDLLRFQAGEIDAARLEAGEDEELRGERGVLRNSEAISRSLGGSLATLLDDDGAAAERLHQASRSLAEIAEWTPDAADWVAELDELRIRLEELARGLRESLDGVSADPARLDAVEERLATIERLARKYGGSTTEILERRERIAAELDGLVLDDEALAELEASAGKALEEFRSRALELSAARASWAEELVRRVHGELGDLAMGRAVFAVALERQRRESSPLVVEGVPIEFSPSGIDQVVFELTANPGEESQPLAKVASGGELSRVYLSLQLALGGGEASTQPTLVFDEVDAGIGGAEAAALGQKLQRLARSEQVLVVTHLPQVASFGDRHFKLSKRVEGGRTHMAVERLEDDSRVQEVARMLAGKEVTDLSRSHAEELIAVAGRGR